MMVDYMSVVIFYLIFLLVFNLFMMYYVMIIWFEGDYFVVFLNFNLGILRFSNYGLVDFLYNWI